jgi:hypothetical protein
VNTDACWALSYITDDTEDSNDKIQAAVSSGVVGRLVQLLYSTKVKVVTPALRTIGNIVTGTDTQTQAVLDSDVMAPLISLLSNKSKNVRKETCWTISNITAGTPHQINQVLRCNSIPPLIRVLKSDQFDVQKEAAWALSNVTSGGNSDQIRYLITQEAAEALCSLLEVDDAKILTVALEALGNILAVAQKDAGGETNPVCDQIEECNGLDFIEALQNHPNEDIYTRSTNLIRKYFEVEEEEEDATLAPNVDNSGSQFSFGAPTGGAPVGQAPAFNFGAPPQGAFTFGGAGAPKLGF